MRGVRSAVRPGPALCQQQSRGRWRLLPPHTPLKMRVAQSPWALVTQSPVTTAPRSTPPGQHALVLTCRPWLSPAGRRLLQHSPVTVHAGRTFVVSVCWSSRSPHTPQGARVLVQTVSVTQALSGNVRLRASTQFPFRH